VTLDAKLPATERVDDFEGIVICGRPRLARVFMSVRARRSGAVICPASHEGACVKLLHFDAPRIVPLWRG
jgi:hypothetical protein